MILRLILCLAILLVPLPVHADYLGSWKIDDLLTFAANTHTASTGAATDADSVPSYRVYEDETGTAILSSTMAKLDDTNTTGFYSEQLTLSAANGFEKGKSYTIYVSAAVGSTTGTLSHTFQIEAEVDANTVSPTVSANAIQISGDAAAADALEGEHENVVWVVYDGNASTSGTALRNAIEGGGLGRIVKATRGEYSIGATSLTFPTLVSLVCDDRDGVIIHGSLASGPQFIPGTLTTIQGVTLRNTSTGDVFGKTSGAISNCVVRDCRILDGTTGVNFSSTSACLVTLEHVILRPGTAGIALTGGAHELRLQEVQGIILSSSATIGMDVAASANVRGGDFWMSLPNAASGTALRVASTAQVALHDSNFYATTTVNIVDAGAKATLVNCEYDRSDVTGQTAQIFDQYIPKDINTIVAHGTYGNAAIKTETASILTQATTAAAEATAADTGTEDIVALLGDPAGDSFAEDISALPTSVEIGTSVWATGARTITGGTITTYTGNTPQTGDSFSRLGAPAGASHAADNAAIKADTAAVVTKLPTAGAKMAGEGAVAKNLDQVEGGGGGGTLTDVDQEPVPDSRTFVLIQTEDEGLVAEKSKSIVAGADPNTYAVDFKNDMPVNGRIATVEPPVIAEGTSGGITFANLGRDKSLAKFRPTGVTAGTYTVRVSVEYHGGATATGTITFVVAE